MEREAEKQQGLFGGACLGKQLQDWGADLRRRGGLRGLGPEEWAASLGWGLSAAGEKAAVRVLGAWVALPGPQHKQI